MQRISLLLKNIFVSSALAHSLANMAYLSTLPSNIGIEISTELVQNFESQFMAVKACLHAEVALSSSKLYIN